MSVNYKKIIRNHINLMLSDKNLKSVHVIADVDAM
jgi:hypothetical protein